MPGIAFPPELVAVKMLDLGRGHTQEEIDAFKKEVLFSQSLANEYVSLEEVVIY